MAPSRATQAMSGAIGASTTTASIPCVQASEASIGAAEPVSWTGPSPSALPYRAP